MNTTTDTSNLDFIHRYVPATDAANPTTLLLLHGTGGNEHDLIELGKSLAPGVGLLSPRGKVSEHGMPRFFRRLAEGVFDEEDLIKRTHELADFVGAAAKVYGFDPDKVIALGYSNGANVAASTLLLRPGVLSGAVLLRGMVPLKPETKPDLKNVPVFLAAGDHDPLIPAANVAELGRMLTDAGAEVELCRSAAGHQLTQGDLQAAAQWLGKKAKSGV
ncbi:alpha/beta hydrolase [Phragmitibacter flavus]|uniref:Alpha/beta hydrolase n=1 Tax=Phragmitibacter flavus TaxID=2576071 RepID=A0A5R8KJC7_9BACT|nr:alpha/beta hydrolase [Phragmitibacter flavus]TLD72351.1 alpha/beta hydrolase [Phragmitibacter flavus]